jgi:hypothetical protein
MLHNEVSAHELGPTSELWKAAIGVAYRPPSMLTVFTLQLMLSS